MKKLLLLFVFSSVTFTASAQKDYSSSPTTEVEYNYATKGYKVQIESGLDMKKGYEFGDIEKLTISGYEFDIKALIRSVQKEVAALLVITTSPISGKKYYFCIPHGSKELYQRYFNDLIVWDESITTAYAYLMSTKLSELASEAFEMEKELKK